MKNNATYENGIIAGRFQPFHLGHLRFATAAAGMVNHLWIGITRPFGKCIPEIGDLRTSDRHNPLPYWLRFKCVESALLCDAGIPKDKFSILPLPLVPVIIKQLLPEGTIFLTNIVEEWSLDKEKLFLEAGMNTLRFDVGVKVISSTIIREKIKKKDRTWRNFVPSSIYKQYAAVINDYVCRGK
jgi:cytidyltransferase-like protein